jgi:predicted HTH transcriptional regulator
MLSEDRLREIITSSDFDLLLGEIENEWFEFKGEPYHIQNDAGKRELAKDVSAFANAQGGYIFIGAERNRSVTRLGDEVESIRPFNQSLLNTNQYHDVIKDWVYPEMEKITVEWRATKTDSSKGVVVIHIPQQKESLKPFLITRTFDDKKRVETLFGYAERKRDTSQPLSVIDLQKALRSGFNYENTVRNRFDKLELLVQQLADNLATVTRQMNELISGRIERTVEHE